MKNSYFFLNFYRRLRVKIKQLLGAEPILKVQLRPPQEYHGSVYGGWSVPLHILRPDSVIVDVGLGEDISFSASLINRYDCSVHGFDPTPRSIEYVTNAKISNLHLHKFGLSAKSGLAMFYLPNDEKHVSGSLKVADHIGKKQIEVELVDLDAVLKIIGSDHIDLLKLDIEGSEYEVFLSSCFARLAPNINILCVEFHHRWSSFGVKATDSAVRRLNELGFLCVWINETTNEEFTFIRSKLL